ncbi:cyclohexanone monooxygenase [Nocardiopsis terrae]|uniref:Cation diffusion facilitator CzcD-associated flavoprotein CzcO n=1 Tax=Nocardiopsis terrae TaxID=372655 RepID=A0ABR9HMJ8_9ACTN|nr:NAD(P)/FAD-dependent oxidoreductase [Nocardiopsis terrae]MBE1460249.1 cation diffusion facilitator CzcD-associated flavoprotein CzcO [Nocardiopsis terrae]GHC70471.1 cyclohexanone monooxygenase [Nocardiopsis terrae]
MSNKKNADFDAIVIGAGFAGIYALYKLRNELGLSVRVFDKAGGVGGTWYWNRYPGAMSDSEGFIYQYSFDRDLLREWTWEKRYLSQKEILAYLERVVERHDLSEDIQLRTSVESAVYDETEGLWTVATGTGEAFTSRYVVTALGPLSTSHFPDFKGRDSFEGRIVHTGSWPDDLQIEGKRVGVIGTGSTGTQFVCAAAKVAGHLTVFQRTPQYNVPSGNAPLDEDYFIKLREDYDRIWDQAKKSRVACGFEESQTAAMSVSASERQRVFQENWERGNGFRFMFGTFSDLIFDPEANKEAADFIKSKIDEIVEDPETARKLQPTDYYAKRPICNEDYYESYNRENVSLVSLKETPIREITPKGLVTEDGVEHELDVLVFATGFEAVEGSYRQLDIRGRGGVTLEEHWGDAPSSYLGVNVSGFPNMFMVYGPNSVFSNLPTAIETQVEWITDLVSMVEERELPSIEPTLKAEEEWTDLCAEIAGNSLFPKVDSWIFGANIPGRKKRVLFYFAGLGNYRQKLRDVAEADYEGFLLGEDREAVSA